MSENLDPEYSIGDITNDLNSKEFSNQTMADYNDPFNFLFGIFASNFNWNDNPYVQFKAY